MELQIILQSFEKMTEKDEMIWGYDPLHRVWRSEYEQYDIEVSYISINSVTQEGKLITEYGTLDQSETHLDTLKKSGYICILYRLSQRTIPLMRMRYVDMSDEVRSVFLDLLEKIDIQEPPLVRLWIHLLEKKRWDERNS